MTTLQIICKAITFANHVVHTNDVPAVRAEATKLIDEMAEAINEHKGRYFNEELYESIKPNMAAIARCADMLGGPPQQNSMRKFIDAELTIMHRKANNLDWADQQAEALYHGSQIELEVQ